MPPLYEGTLFYMPVTVPAASVSVVSELLGLQDRLLKSIPEVDQVFGKAGRAETATDPAPLEMFETVINLKPESKWRPGMTVEKLKDEMNDLLTIPGVANSFTMPIKARIDMLATGIRTPVGIKVLGPRIEEIERIGLEIEHHVKDSARHPQRLCRTGDHRLFSGCDHQPAGSGPLRIERGGYSGSGGSGHRRHECHHHRGGAGTLSGQYPLPPGTARQSGSSEPGADPDPGGRTRPPPPREAGWGPVGGRSKGQVPLGQVAEIRTVKGPTAIKSEEGLLSAYVFVDFSGRDVGGYVEEAKKKVASLKIPDRLSPGLER